MEHSKTGSTSKQAPKETEHKTMIDFYPNPTKRQPQKPIDHRPLKKPRRPESQLPVPSSRLVFPFQIDETIPNNNHSIKPTDFPLFPLPPSFQNQQMISFATDPSHDLGYNNHSQQQLVACRNNGPNPKTDSLKAPAATKGYRGVRQRQGEKWVAEIRLPRNRTRLWLGTFGNNCLEGLWDEGSKNSDWDDPDTVKNLLSLQPNFAGGFDDTDQAMFGWPESRG